MSRTAEQVLASVAVLIAKAETEMDWHGLKALTAEYLPAPDPLTLAAEECVWTVKGNHPALDPVPKVRAIIARVVAAAEPSDEALLRVYNYRLANLKDFIFADDLRAALKGEVK